MNIAIPAGGDRTGERLGATAAAYNTPTPRCPSTILTQLLEWHVCLFKLAPAYYGIQTIIDI